MRLSTQKDEFDRAVDVSGYKLHEGGVLVVWMWSWIDVAELESDEEVESECESSVRGEISDDCCCDGETPSEAACEVPEITHSAVFKCIGVNKEHRYQEIVAVASRQLRDGETVPVRLTKEPHNPTCNSL